MTFVTNNNQETVLSGTWDNSGAAYTKLAINVNDVTSVSTSKLLDLQTNGQSRFSVRKDGLVFTKDGRITSDTTLIFHPNGQSQGYASISMYSLDLGQDVDLFWKNNPYATGGSPDTGIVRDGTAGALAQRVSTQSQTYRIYNTYGGTPAGTDFERASLGWNASAFEIETEAGGLGSARSLILGTSSIPRITITPVGNITFNTSSTAAPIVLHGKNTVELYNWGSFAPAVPLGNNIRFIGYQTTNESSRPTIEIKDLRGSHRNNFFNGLLGPGLSFSFEVLNDVGGALAEKTVGGLFTVVESGAAGSFGLAFASNGYTEKMRLSNAGNLGIGTNAPTQRLHVSGNTIITSSLSVSAGATISGTLTVYQTATNQRVYDYRNPSGNNLYYSVMDISNFHHYHGVRTYHNLNGNGYVFDGNNNPNSSVSIGGQAALVLNPSLDGTYEGIKYGTGTYATSAIPTPLATLLTSKTWAWNGSNGFSLFSVMGIRMRQLTQNNDDARFSIYAWPVGAGNPNEILNILSKNSSVGINVQNPVKPFEVSGASLIVGNADGSVTGTLLTLSSTRADASSTITFRTNGMIFVGTDDNVFGEKIRLNNSYGIDTFGGGGIAIRGGAYVNINSASYANGLFSGGFSGAPSFRIRSQYENQLIFKIHQESNGTPTNTYFTVAKGTGANEKTLFTIVSSGWTGLGVSAPLAPLHVFASSFPLVKVQHSGNTVNSGWDFMVGNPGNYDGWFMIARSGQLVPGDFALDTGGNARVANSIYIKGTPLTSDANNILAQRLGTTSQKFRVYNTYGGADFEALEIGHRLYSTSQFQYVSAITSGTGAANIGIAIVPAGTGAFTLAVPDGGTTGGNTRGIYAIDLQTLRTDNTGVAAGQEAIVIGTRNKASAAWSLAMGNSCDSQSTRCISIGSYSTAVSLNSIAIGMYNTANSRRATVLGNNAYTENYGAFCYATGNFGTQTEVCQSTKLIYTNFTSGATETELFLDGSAAAYRAKPRINTAWFCDIKVLGRQVSGVNHASYWRRCLIENTGNTVQMVSAVETIGTDVETNSAWDVSVTADNTNKSLKIAVTGVADTNIRWMAEVNVLELNYGNS